MAHVISFTTSKFDPGAETPNPINPIAGRSILEWLDDPLTRGGCTCGDPDAEDWGWYMDVESNGVSYMLGGCCLIDEDAPSSVDHEWMIQVVKRRTFLETLFGKNTLANDDPLSAQIVEIIRSEPAFLDVNVSRDK